MASQNEMTISELYNLLKKTQEEQTIKLLEEFRVSQKDTITKIEKNKEEIDDLHAKNLSLERKIRKNNIIVFGLKTNNENLLNTCIDKLNNLLGTSIKNSDINNIYTIGKEEKKKGIHIEFISHLVKQEIYKNISKLKNTKISIVNDLCPEDQDTHRILVKHLKEARARNHTAKIIGHKLEINNKLFTAEELESQKHVHNIETEEGSSEDHGEPELEGSETEEEGNSNTLKQAENKKSKKRNKKKNAITQERITTRSVNK